MVVGKSESCFIRNRWAHLIQCIRVKLAMSFNSRGFFHPFYYPYFQKPGFVQPAGFHSNVNLICRILALQLGGTIRSNLSRIPPIMYRRSKLRRNNIITRLPTVPSPSNSREVYFLIITTKDYRLKEQLTQYFDSGEFAVLHLGHSVPCLLGTT